MRYIKRKRRRKEVIRKVGEGIWEYFGVGVSLLNILWSFIFKEFRISRSNGSRVGISLKNGYWGG